jgi:rhamnulokinase
MSKELNLIAIDCGNSGIRVTLGRFNGSRVQIQLIHQIEQKEVFFNGYFYWDFLFIYQQLKNALRKAHAEYGRIDSAAISTWGIDFGLLNQENYLLANPLSYRNSLGKRALDTLTEEQRRFNFFHTGIRCDRINTLYQILGFREAYPQLFGQASRLFLVPDLLNYLFTGEAWAESTESSTSQVYDVQTKGYSDEVLRAFNIDKNLFPPLKEHGEARGQLKKEIADELGINVFPFITIPSHDTAAAVTSICPEGKGDEHLFISSGTWSLIGVELPEPLVNETVYNSDFTNEGGILGTITFLKNSAGMYIARRLYDEFFPQGEVSWDWITEKVSTLSPAKLLFDPNDEDLFNPLSMREAISQKTGIGVEKDFELFRVIYDSLAYSYQEAIEEIERIMGRTYDTIHVVGGGSRNKLLNKLTADLTRKAVAAGPDEATSIGNLGVQLLYGGNARGLSDIRRIIKNSIQIAVYS